jgi:hypothetical protein
MYKMTHSLLESWRRATDPDADETAFGVFLDTLEREKRQKTKAMQDGIDFENAVTRYINNEAPDSKRIGDELRAIAQFGNRLRGAQLQVREEKEIKVCGREILLVGVADALKAGILSDIKRVQRYEYGKYQFSTQHPMYMELFPEALRFDYLIFDGKYCYMEQYRRGDFEPIHGTIKAFLEYLDGAELMETYQKNWEV